MKRSKFITFLAFYGAMKLWQDHLEPIAAEVSKKLVEESRQRKEAAK